jgi:hypothetical protein
LWQDTAEACPANVIMLNACGVAVQHLGAGPERDAPVR